MKNIIKYLESKYGNTTGGPKVLKRNSKRLRNRINRELIKNGFDEYYSTKRNKLDK